MQHPNKRMKNDVETAGANPATAFVLSILETTQSPSTADLRSMLEEEAIREYDCIGPNGNIPLIEQG